MKTQKILPVLRFRITFAAALLCVGTITACSPRTEQAKTTAPPAAASGLKCTTTDVRALLKRELSEYAGRNPIPGAVGAVLIPALGPDPVAEAVGASNLESGRPMTLQDRLLTGSVGKTFFAAAALKLADEGKLDLDAPMAKYLPKGSVPNADTVTPRMLLSHRTGFPSYDAEFMTDLIYDPLRVRTLADWAGPVRRSKKLGEPNASFEYSDVNFVLLASVIEGATGEPVYAVIQRLLLQPLALNDTVPADRVQIERLASGYEGTEGVFKVDNVLGPNGLVFNPQFESGGGGFASTPADLTRWIDALRNGRALPAHSWQLMSTPTSTSKEGSYGLGMHVDQTPLGLAYGHSGYIPGYLTWLRWYEPLKLAVAVQTNTSDDSRFKDKGSGYDLIDHIANLVAQRCALLPK